jgi:FkbM family methyltransferase
MRAQDVKELLKKENPLILEVGACDGADTKIFLKEFKDIKIYCFEPDPRCIKIFKKHIKDDRCALIEAAVSNTDKKKTLYLSKYSQINFNLRNVHDMVNLAKDLKDVLFKGGRDSLGQASIMKSISRSKDYPWLIFDQNLEVKTLKLDTWAKENNICFIDLIWSDVQGAEREMIDGAITTLRITKYFYAEYGETSVYPEAMTRDEIIELLGKHNFGLIEEYSDKSRIGNLLFCSRTEKRT